MVEPQTNNGANNGSHWLNWCRLCAKDDPRGNVKVDFTNGDDFTTWDNVLLMAIRKYFEVHMCLQDELSSVLCTECYTLISELLDFAEHVSKVQAIFEVLRRGATEPNNQLDVAALRQQYGLREGDWTHIIKPSDFEGDIESNEVKEEVVKQEFIDLGGSFQCEELLENESNQLVQEEFIAIECDPNEVMKQKPIKRPRGRPKAVEPKRSKRSAKDAAVVPQKMQKFHKVTDKSKEIESSENLLDVQTRTDSPNSSKYLNDEVDLLREGETIAPLPDPGDVSSESEASVAAAGHSGSRAQMECKDCGKSYQNPASYQKHIDNGCRKTAERSKVNKNTTCKMCNKKLSSATALKLHMEGMHENSKPFICDCCGKALKTITALNEHKLVHTDDRPFVCPLCKAGFKNRARLKIHSQIHEEPSYVCNICGKKLQTRRTWNMHKLVHTEERKLKCDVCGAGFKRSKSLKTHLLSHTGLRPYVCNYCGRTFACNANCRAHKLKKHPEEVEQEDGDGTSSRLSVPTLEELRVMTQKIAKMPNET